MESEAITGQDMDWKDNIHVVRNNTGHENTVISKYFAKTNGKIVAHEKQKRNGANPIAF